MQQNPQMPTLKYTFRNKGLGEFNDDVFDRQIFDLSNNKFTFLIQPSDKTKFWRFGFVLSKTKEFQFLPTNGRYNNKDLKFIEIDVGDKPSGAWQSSNLIALGSYYIEGFIGKPKIKRGYKEYSEVEISLKFDSDRNVYASYSSTNLKDSEHFPISGYYKKLYHK